MKQNKAMSWGAAVFIVSFCALAFTPLIYLLAIGKQDGHLNPKLGALEIFSVDSQASGGFTLGYGLGALLIPAVLSLVVWGVLLILSQKQQK